MKKIVLLICMLTFIVCAAAYAEEIKITSGGTTATYVLEPVKDAFEKATGIKLNIAKVGGKPAVVELDKGASEMAGAAHTMDEVVEGLKKDGVELKNLASIKVHKAMDPVMYAIIVHKDNPVTKLTKEQAKGLFTGKIQNWKELGGNDTPILIVVPKLQPFGQKILSGKLMDKEPVTTDVLEVNVYTDVRDAVASNPESIGMVMAADVSSGVKQVETPVAVTTGPVNLFTIGDPSPKAQKLIDFVRGEGKQYLKK